MRFSERVQVNREAIPDADVVRSVQWLQELLRQLPADHHPTFFEVVTVLALTHFAQQRCDLVIWETGMGGRLDATNIVTPLASVITNIQFDHQNWLGTTRAQIATEKAGIIKPGVPVLTATEESDALEVIAETARAQQAPLAHLGRTHAAFPQAAELQLSLLGDHQKLNAPLAIATVHRLAPQLPVRESELRQGLERVRWPGRLQLITRPDGRQLLLDGAHNLAGAETLKAESLVDTEVDPSSIVLDRSCAKLIWVGQTTGRVQRSNLDGSGVEDVFTRQNIWHLDIAPDVLVPVQQRSWSDVKNLLR